MIKIYLTHSGNLGDTLNALPVLDAISKRFGDLLHLIVRDRMRIFNGIDDLFMLQPFIGDFNFESDDINRTDAINLPLCDDKISIKSDKIPNETMRYYTSAIRVFDTSELTIDTKFRLNIPCEESILDIELVGDRQYHPVADSRRKFDILKPMFQDNRYTFLDYRESIVDNAALIKQSTKPFHTTFTGIAVLADLLFKSSYIYYDETLENWAGRNGIYESFDQHFFRDRNCRLVKIC